MTIAHQSAMTSPAVRRGVAPSSTPRTSSSVVEDTSTAVTLAKIVGLVAVGRLRHRAHPRHRDRRRAVRARSNLS